MPGFAFVGKGGSGKSTIAGTFSRLVARRGHDVLVLDADHVPGLATAVGLVSEDTAMLADAVTVDESSGRPMLSGSVEDTIQGFARDAPDGLRFLQFGKLTAPTDDDVRASTVAFRQVSREQTRDRVVVTDLSAGTRQAYFGWAGSADTLLTVVTPSQKAVLTARRLVPLVEWLTDVRHLVVLNDVLDDDEAEATERILTSHGFEVAVRVPHDATVAAAARAGVAPIDHAPRSDFVAAVSRLVDLVLPDPRSDAVVA